jgi:hypothetical protein
MTTKKDTREETGAETKPASSAKSTAVGGLVELQAKADDDAARGYRGGSKEDS